MGLNQSTKINIGTYGVHNSTKNQQMKKISNKLWGVVLVVFLIPEIDVDMCTLSWVLVLIIFLLFTLVSMCTVLSGISQR